MADYEVQVTRTVIETVYMLIEGVQDEADAKACAMAGDGMVTDRDLNPDIKINSVDDIHKVCDTEEES